ncbi:MAG: crosslink repair DNA glycosylase YcaQ family protein [Acidobacteriota bacterium]
MFSRRWSELPRRAAGSGQRAQQRCLEVIRRFGYLQLDSVSVCGLRSHALVLLSRLQGLDPGLPESLLYPGSQLFEYWGHEASWLPMESYPVFAFRRREFRVHPWWGDLLGEHADLADGILQRLQSEGPLTSAELGRRRSSGWWNLGLTKKVVIALWSAGDVGIRERKGFHRTFDLTENLIPEVYRASDWSTDRSLRYLLLKALDGHGWASTATLIATWRIQRQRKQVLESLAALEDEGKIVRCRLRCAGRPSGIDGWIQPQHLELVDPLRRIRPAKDRGTLLSPFDPVLWDRQRVQLLFGFEQILEIYKPADQRRWGYYCLPVLAGDSLIGRVDLKADKRQGALRVLATHFESDSTTAEQKTAMASALRNYADALALDLSPTSSGLRLASPNSPVPGT